MLKAVLTGGSVALVVSWCRLRLEIWLEDIVISNLVNSVKLVSDHLDCSSPPPNPTAVP